jgi:hypothetical protein
MGRLIDDKVKQTLFDSLAEEPTMGRATAYAYAKNYVDYGTNITKAWVTATEQASILEQIKIKTRAEAYDSFKKDYEDRLKADMVAMLTEIQLEIEEIEIGNNVPFGFEPVSKTSAFYDGVSASSKVVQQKIDSLKGGGNDSKKY